MRELQMLVPLTSEELQELRETVKKLKIDNDYIFMKTMQHKNICKRFIEILLGKKVRKLTYTLQSKKKTSFWQKPSVLTSIAEGSDTVINIELQTSHYENLVIRARYYKSILDATSLKKGDDYEKLKDCVVVFLCKADPFGKGLPIYTLKTKCIESAFLAVDDKTTLKFFNCAQYKKVEDKELRGLMQYIYT